jgi:hypothetical protein
LSGSTTQGGLSDTQLRQLLGSNPTQTGASGSGGYLSGSTAAQTGLSDAQLQALLGSQGGAQTSTPPAAGSGTGGSGSVVVIGNPNNLGS